MVKKACNTPLVDIAANHELIELRLKIILQNLPNTACTRTRGGLRLVPQGFSPEIGFYAVGFPRQIRPAPVKPAVGLPRAKISQE